MRKLACAVCSLATAAAWISSARAGDGADALTLERAVSLAVERNPELAVLRTEVDVAKATLDGASRLLGSNPRLSGEVGPRLRDGERTRVELGAALEQQFEIAGQRSARVETAEAFVRSADARVDARERALIADVKIAFTRALAARAKVAIAKEAEALAESTVSAVVERERLGDATRIDVNSARIEVGRAIRERLTLEREESEALGELALLIGLDLPDLQVAGDLHTATATVPTIEEALAVAKRERRELIVARAEVEAAEAEARLAFREAFPDVGLGVLYENEEGAHIVQGSLSFELPLFDRNQAERGASDARVVRAQRSRAAMERAVEQEVRLAFRRYASARRAVETYAEGVEAAIRENLELGTEAYRAGKFDFLELIVVRREAVAAQRGRVEALETLNAAEAELARAIGRKQ